MTPPQRLLPHILLLILSVLACAGPAHALELRSGERVEVGGPFTDMVLVGARDATIRLSSPDDVLVGARDARFIDAATGHAFVAAETASFAGSQADDLFVMAREARFERGGVRDDLMAAARAIVIRPDFRIGGSAMAAGADVDLGGPVGGDLMASGQSVRLDGAVGGTVKVSAERLVVGPNARIAGDLIYQARTVEIAPGAVIQGRRIARPLTPEESPAGAFGAVIGGMLTAFLVFVVGGALLVLAVVSLFPTLMDRSAGRIDTRPLPTLGLGLLIMGAGPAVIILLMISLVGAPLALLVGALYLAATPLALAVAVHWAGMRARRAAARGRPLQPIRGWARLGWSLLAALALVVLGALPIVGGVVWLAALMAGLGALTIEARRALANG